MLLAGILGVATLFFWPTLVELPATWNASYREHGFFVAGLVGWLIWRDRRRIIRASTGGAEYLLPVVAGLSFLWLLSAVMGVRVGQQLALTGVGVAVALAVFGWGARRRILAIGVTFLLALPIWEFLVPPLQRATTVASGLATRLAGIEAEVGYDYIQISTGRFLVEGGCAGLNYLLGALTLGAVYAHLFVPRWRTQLKIVALAGVVSIVGNWIRVSVLVFLGEATAMQSPYIEDHLWQGWAIFMALMVPTYFLALRIEKRDARRFGGPTDAVSETVESSDASDRPAMDPRHPRRASRAALVAVLGPVLFMVIGAVPRDAELDTTPEALGIVDPWTVVADEPLDDWRPGYVGVDREVGWTISDGADSIGALRQYYIDPSQGDELISWANVIAPDSMVVDDRVIGPIGPSRRLVREALIRTEAEPRVVWYWYRVAGFETPFRSKATLLEVPAFFGRSSASELITVTAICEPDDCREAGGALRRAFGAPPLPPRTDTGAAEDGSSGPAG